VPLNTSTSQTGFAARHIGPDSPAVAAMLAVIGIDSLDELASKAVPAGILDRLTASGAAPGLDKLPAAASETEALAELRALADANTVAVSMIGQGYYDTLTPPVLLRNIMENPAWYTAYTPYQPEISQGRLEALLNFQTLVTDLTGLEIANASMLDEGTAAAESMTLMHRAARGSANRLAVDADLFAQTAAVLATRAKPLGIEIVTADLSGGLPDGEFFGVITQLPGASGRITDWSADYTARRDRRRRRVRQHPKVRRANGIRRSACGVSGGPYQACPSAAWPLGRRIGGRRRVAGLPAGIADPRAAHPP
jgi:glycine dehydrogenase